MSQRVVVDPVTRIEGHLRVEVEVDGGRVVDAWCMGTMFRGFEEIIRGKDPRDATYVAERICGVCMGSHGWTAALAVEKAFGAQVPTAGRLIRNLLVGSLWLHDHPLHFYHLSALDYLDITAIGKYQGNDPGLQHVKAKVMALVEAGDAYPLLPRYEPDEYSVKDPEIVTTAVAHYLKALEIQAKAKKMSAILGGKQPHQSSIIVGGVTSYPNLEQLRQFEELLQEVIDFVKNVYVPDVLAFATGPLLPLAQASLGAGPGNYLAYGAFPLDDAGNKKLFEGGVILDNNLNQVHPLDHEQITEAVTHSWYKEGTGGYPGKAVTEVDLDKSGAYSFIKAPRYAGRPMEVGPLARMLVKQHAPLLQVMAKYNIRPGAVARHVARALETLLIADAMPVWLEELIKVLDSGKAFHDNGSARIHDAEHWEPPERGEGMGLNEAPRGALGHWVRVANRKVEHYQIIVPTTWNASPRDEQGQRGPIEHALVGTPVPDPENPINIVRVIRSFDPCLACAVHVVEPSSGREGLISIM
ncbi:hydrogenase large subunit [Thermanaeromonas toyohensis ToBE]|uniref:Hydrogenase large subunit n=1 Tax=Thermanaeromonas toyohensis ToBE TaxID=698762 RepID=A0A1W1VIF4_9FIRM|nr:nickel-dependent hydrogenase large subunit [Thermanaeromonas toyohensis]SMB93106.1 hydrogenase large subunit [Thermanaeromonas toyohensis ToBE]